ncbi:MAG: acyloxyacyl hydrolase [Phycisphaerales bacterium]
MRIPALIASCLLVPAALADDYVLDTQTANYNFTAATAKAIEPETPPTEAAAHKPFGSSGNSLVTFGGGVAYSSNEGDTATDSNLYVAWNYFLATDIEFSLEAGLWYFNQTGPNQWGGSGTLAFRWHFVNKQTWSLFLEAGVGLLGASGEVPTGGTSFDFMPRAGGGFTYEITPGGPRLQAGVRWYHVSNARIDGDSNNPARDGVMGFVGIMFPLN